MKNSNSDLAVAALMEEEKREENSQRPSTLNDQFETWSKSNQTTSTKFPLVSSSSWVNPLIVASVVLVMAFVIRPPFLCTRKSHHVHTRLSLIRVFALALSAGSLTWVLEWWMLSKDA